MSDEYRRGVDVLAQLGLATAETTANRVAEVAPDFARMAIAFPYGEVFARPRLDLASRELAAVSALAARGDAIPQLRVHVAAALRIGWSREALVEALMQVAIFAGFPAAINAISACHDMLSSSAGCSSPAQSSGLGDGH
ncbi:carboxymuconolactone decarboxylase family protein [Sphingomonas sp.]|uniref:carboxymuconolactone decarboxylase family protein n=1 Tax=Sphingomonas sp. TaxID=28214 RepID=UPI001B0C2B8F|nr:carboxymuconolactone decarboxylase family protein [Sphingomonas sp.]MBO9711694.1 carboxymuconolactone decarboxylase family protein [Sphingomonas sp.]